MKSKQRVGCRAKNLVRTKTEREKRKVVGLNREKLPRRIEIFGLFDSLHSGIAEKDKEISLISSELTMVEAKKKTTDGKCTQRLVSRSNDITIQMKRKQRDG